MNTLSYISLPKAFYKTELDPETLKKIDKALKLDLSSKYTQVAKTLLATETFQKRKIALLYHVTFIFKAIFINTGRP